MSLGLVVSEKKLFTRTRTPTPQSDDIKIIKDHTCLEAGMHSLSDFVDTLTKNFEMCHVKFQLLTAKTQVLGFLSVCAIWLTCLFFCICVHFELFSNTCISLKLMKWITRTGSNPVLLCPAPSDPPVYLVWQPSGDSHVASL